MQTNYFNNIIGIIQFSTILFSLHICVRGNPSDNICKYDSHEKLYLDVDTTRKDFLPLSVGNTWQYIDPSGKVSTRKIIGDTVIDNKQYYIIEGSYLRTIGKIIRIDSLMRIQERFSYPIGDSCGGTDMYEMSIYHLNEIRGSFWKICSNFYEMLTDEPMVMIGPEYSRYINGEKRDAMDFYFGGVLEDTNTVFYKGATFIKGIGLVEEHTFEGNYNKLQGAIINGIQYGTIVDVKENEKYYPSNITLYQNYPNPFNSETTVRISVNKTEYIKLTIFNIMGEEIETLVSDTYLPGIYDVKFNASKLCSGVYIYSLVTMSSSLSKVMLLLK